MLFFGGKEKKLRNTNDTLKNEVLRQIQTLSMNCRDTMLAGLLNDLRRELESQGTCSTEKGIAYLQQAITFLSEANSYIVQGQKAPAENRLSKAKEVVATRRAECTAGGQMTKRDEKNLKKMQSVASKIKGGTVKESREDELKLQLSKAIAAKAEKEAEVKKLVERLQKNPNDREAQALWTSAEDAYNKAERTIQNIQNELGIEVFNDMMASLEKEMVDLKKGRTISSEQAEVTMQNVARAQEEANAEQDQLAANRAKYLGNSAGQSSATSSPLFQQMAGGAGAGANSFANSPLFQQMAGGSASSATGGATSFNPSATTGDYSRQLNEIKRAQSALEQSQETYREKMEEANDELRELNNQLKPLLAKRRSATPTDCLMLDGQIDQLNSKRNSVQHAIRRYRNALAELMEKAQLMDKLEIQKDLESTAANLKRLTGGQFEDFGSIAMYIKEGVQKANEQLEDIGTANAVADGEEINVNSFSGSSAVYTDRTDAKDEDKYSALEQDLGLSF